MRNQWMGILSGLGAALWICASGTAHAATCGDVNGSGSVTSADLTILNLRLFGGPQPGDCGGLGTLQCGDLNGDGSIGTGDLVVLSNSIAGNPVVFNCTPPGTAQCNNTVSGTINSNQTWGNADPGSGTGCTTTVNGTTFVSPGVVITMKPGLRVQGVKGAPTPSALVFQRGAKINAAGTAGEPIVFTSNQPDGSRGTGDWGGVVLNGNAPVNCPGGSCLAEGLSAVEFGGNNPNDTSGVMTYCRVEFSGIELSADNELNVLTMNGVGRGTLMDHIQVNQGFDDGFEWFGGTVNMKYLAASSIGDDDFDWQLGYTGSVQFGLGIKNAANHDNNGRQGIEADNNENGFNFTPVSNPRFCNLTLVGTRAQGQTGTGRRGLLLRRGTAGKVQNTIIDGYTQSAIQLDDNATASRACVNATTLNTTEPFLRVKDAIVFDNGANTTGSASSPCTPAQWFTQLQASQNVVAVDPNIDETSVPYPVTVSTGPAAADGYVPTAPAATGSDCAALNPTFFTSATYIGAFQPATGSAGNWLRDSATWVNFDTN